MKNQIVWVDIPVSNLDRAIGFYSALLGEPVRKESASGFVFGLFPHADTHVAGCLYMPTPGDNQPSQTGPLVYLNVDGRLEAALAAVSQHGGKVLQAKHSLGPHGFRAIVVDTEGNRVALHSQTA
jgi:hypothetical protein